MHLVLDSAFLKALGWSLADSLWQTGILWVIYVLLTANGRRYRSAIRYSLAVFSLAGGLLCFIINLVLRFSSDGSTYVLALPGLSGRIAGTLKSVLPSMEFYLPVFSAAYLFVVVILFFRLLKQYADTRKLQTRGLSKPGGGLRIFFHDIVALMGIRGDVKIWLSSLVDTPMTIGFLKPVVLLPIAMINQLSMEQVEAIILHELNHIRRNDYLINLLVAFCDIIFFFNPFARILANIVKREREHSCDDMVLQFQYKPSQYADALLLLEKNRLKENRIALAAMGTNHFLFQRVKRILTGKSIAQPLPQRMIAGLISVMLLIFIGWYDPGKKKIEDTAVQPDVRMETPSMEPQAVIAKVDALPAGAGLNEKTVDIDKAQSDHGRQLQNNEYIILQEILDQYKKALKEQVEKDGEEGFVSFATELPSRAFSIPGNNNPESDVNESGIYPYVPSSSFSYQIVEDTSHPKKHIFSFSEVKAKEAMDKAIQALHEIDWQKLDKELKASGQNLDIVKLQEQISKAFSDVDWNKVNQEVESSMHQAEAELLNNQEALQLQIQLLRSNQRERVEKLKEVREKILQDRLQPDNQKELEIQERIIRKAVKKIVYI